MTTHIDTLVRTNINFPRKTYNLPVAQVGGLHEGSPRCQAGLVDGGLCTLRAVTVLCFCVGTGQFGECVYLLLQYLLQRCLHGGWDP